MMDNLDMNRIPEHIAIIMDGNGRWATERGKERSFGHQAGVDTVRRITSECTRLGVKYLTLYTFSTENWNRPAERWSEQVNKQIATQFSGLSALGITVNTADDLPAAASAIAQTLIQVNTGIRSSAKAGLTR